MSDVPPITRPWYRPELRLIERCTCTHLLSEHTGPNQCCDKCLCMYWEPTLDDTKMLLVATLVIGLILVSILVLIQL